MVKGIVSTGRAMMGAFVLITIALTLFAIAAVEFIQPELYKLENQGAYIHTYIYIYIYMYVYIYAFIYICIYIIHVDI